VACVQTSCPLSILCDGSNTFLDGYQIYFDTQTIEAGFPLAKGITSDDIINSPTILTCFCVIRFMAQCSGQSVFPKIWWEMERTEMSCIRMLIVRCCSLMGPLLISFGLNDNAAVKQVPNDYPTISLAVSAAVDGDTIRVYAGTYAEHVNVTKSLFFIGSWPDTATTIQPPVDFMSSSLYRYQSQPALFNPRAALVRIAPGTNVLMQGFVVDGMNPNRDTSNVAFTGILIESASATIKRNKVMGFLPSDTSGAPNATFSGRGIEVLGGDAESTIDSNIVVTCQRYHILVSSTDDKTATPGAFPKATVYRNTVMGLGQSKLGQKGIWYNWGAYGKISDNTITQLDYTVSAVEPDRASAVVVRHGEFRTSGKSRIVISGNTITASTANNNKAIFIEGNCDSVVGNTISGFRWNVQVDDQDSAYVLGNTITGGNVGVLVSATTGSKTVSRLVTIGGSTVNKNTITGQPPTSQGGAAIQLVFRETGGDGEFLSPLPVVATHNDFGVYTPSEVAARVFDRADTSNGTWPASIDTVVFDPFYTPKLRASVKVFLQGPYSSPTDSMSRTLNTGGTLAARYGAGTYPALAVDSVNIELRTASSAAASTTRKFVPAWLLNDGTVQNFADPTKSYVEFDTTLTGNYYLVVRHRNHIPIMCNTAQWMDGSTSPTVYDFSTAQAKAFGTNPMILVDSSPGTVYAMYSGEVNQNGLVNAADRTIVKNNTGASGFNVADVNLSGLVNAADRTIVKSNTGVQSQVP